MQLTHDNSGHTIHNTQCFSQDDQWIVYDTRNNDTMIASTGSISMVNTQTGEIRELYHTKHQTLYGPGVGAATFSPVANRVIFIHGVQNADKTILMDLHAAQVWQLILQNLFIQYLWMPVILLLHLLLAHCVAALMRTIGALMGNGSALLIMITLYSNWKKKILL